jgi:hypothetical protein
LPPLPKNIRRCRITSATTLGAGAAVAEQPAVAAVLAVPGVAPLPINNPALGCVGVCRC